MPRSVAINKLESKFYISNHPNPSDEFKVKIEIIPNAKIPTWNQKQNTNNKNKKMKFWKQPIKIIEESDRPGKLEGT